MRSILDGHIVLSRELAAENHYPAIDILRSISRVMPAVTTKDHQRAAAALREALATYEKARDLVNIGAYVAGSNPRIDSALKLLPGITSFLRQPPDEASAYDTTLSHLSSVASEP